MSQERKPPIPGYLLRAMNDVRGIAPDWMIVAAVVDVYGYSNTQVCNEFGVCRSNVRRGRANMTADRRRVYDGVVQHFKDVQAFKVSTIVTEGKPKPKKPLSSSAQSMIKANLGDRFLARYQAKQKAEECRHDGKLANAIWYERVAEELK